MTTGDMTPKQAMLRLGLAGSSFWRSIWQGVDAGVVIAIKWGPSSYRFDAASIEAWRELHLVRSRADLRRLTDGRRAPKNRP